MDSNWCNAGYMGSRTSDINISIRGTGKACITNESQDFGRTLSRNVKKPKSGSWYEEPYSGAQELWSRAELARIAWISEWT